MRSPVRERWRLDRERGAERGRTVRAEAAPMHIDASVIRVTSLEAAVEFWTTAGGMEIAERQRGGVEVEHPARGRRLRLGEPVRDWCRIM